MSKEIKLSVKELADFTSKSGNLNSDFVFNLDPSEGQKAHKYYQARYNKESISEYFIEDKIPYKDYIFVIQGRIDGVIKENGNEYLEEFKTTKIKLAEINENYHLEYQAQLKIYMALYARKNNLDQIEGKLKYIYNETYETKSFNYCYSKKELNQYLNSLLDVYLTWQLLINKNEKAKEKSAEAIRFPYSKIRVGQKDMMKAVFYAIKNRKVMFINAPTGIGKTISSLYPSVKSIYKKDEKIFYLTSKNSQKMLAENAFKEMLNKGLDMRLITITSKENICLKKCELCQMETCKYALDFYKREREAIKEILEKEKLITKNVVLEYSSRYMICPFEFSLDVSLFSDVIICDYNYIYDPRVKLIRYFGDDSLISAPIVLVDEAHNLVSRSNDMYSALISYSLITKLKKGLKGKKPSINKKVNTLKQYLDNLNGFENNRLVFDTLDFELVDILTRINDNALKIFEENDAAQFENKTKLMLLSFEINSFLKIASIFSNSHRLIIEKENNDYLISISCLDASVFLSMANKKMKTVVFFSATLQPLNYYKALLNDGNGEHLILPTSFPKSNRKLIFYNSVSTKYKQRENSVKQICDAINIMVNSKKGNYICFFPSYEYLSIIYDPLLNYISLPIIKQERTMTQDAREQIIDLFLNDKTPKIGLFVMGGTFSEGIDYVGEALSGVLIIGLGIPQINYLNEMTKNYFDGKFKKGYDYTYRYPGFNKVLQASGRVIRSEEDKGVIIILDSRITNSEYLEILPPDWDDYKVVSTNLSLYDELASFWHKK